MQFEPTGFSQNRDWRVFTYDAVGPDTTKLRFKVRADLMLCRRYGIPDREIALMCAEILVLRIKQTAQSRNGLEDQRTVILDERFTRDYAKKYVAARDAADLGWQEQVETLPAMSRKGRLAAGWRLLSLRYRFGDRFAA